MSNLVGALSLATLLLLSAGCGTIPTEGGGPDAGGGDTCDPTDPAHCAGDWAIEVCTDTDWQQYDCTQLCLDQGYDGSTGCHQDDGDGLFYCYCSGGPCTDGDTMCNGAGTIDYCSDGEYVNLQCDAVCIQQGYDHATGYG